MNHRIIESLNHMISLNLGFREKHYIIREYAIIHADLNFIVLVENLNRILDKKCINQDLISFCVDHELKFIDNCLKYSDAETEDYQLAWLLLNLT